MMGNWEDANSAGLVPRACAEIFARITHDESGAEFSIKCSFLEIYNEKIRDLLDPERADLRIHQSPSKGIYVEDLTEQVSLSLSLSRILFFLFLSIFLLPPPPPLLPLSPAMRST